MDNQQQVYAIRDTKGGDYDRPFSEKNHDTAIRAFKATVNKPGSFLGMYPDDFDLFHLGAYNKLTGKIEGLDTPVHVIKANQLVEKPAAQ